MGDDSDPHVMSFYRVRQALGVIALFLPAVLIVGGMGLEHALRDSVSNFFFSPLREVFTGSLAAIGVFLIAYKGYPRRSDETFSDQVLASVAGMSALLVAFFPSLADCIPPEGMAQCMPPEETVTQKLIGVGGSSWVHNISALVFFLCLVVFCLVQFPKTESRVRPYIYKACGYGILVALAGIAGAFAMARWGGAEAFVAAHNLVFWGEAVGIWIFALAWLTKGKADQAALNLLRRAVASEK
ncbi:hypothetical protein CEW89_07780 [Celeribacter ethanolicus]|uniref:DUF998 domain-containing protein n=1 Tax=Celeribacter ethanolicus TaxID=1758178 RepID=A0A291GAP4_9RHOB|nr:DUF998 domain-containing protein [Celeribacter ethanolicus]ATG47479.1 hypothetical protein CEW89_07780 [Celeribacter ethanolicus]